MNAMQVYRTDEERMLLAIFQNKLNEIRRLARAGIDLEMKLAPFGYTPLNYAICRGRIEIVKLLLEYSAVVTDESLQIARDLGDHMVACEMILTLIKAKNEE